jgi:hypothetical protein
VVKTKSPGRLAGGVEKKPGRLAKASPVWLRHTSPYGQYTRVPKLYGVHGEPSRVIYFLYTLNIPPGLEK